MGGEAAAEEDLAAVAAEHLVVRRDRDQVAQGIHAELSGGRALDGALDELLDDAAHGSELLPEEVPGHVPRLEGQVRQAPPDPGRQPRPPRRAAVVEDGVALAGEALVELHDRPREAGPPRPEVGEGLGDRLGTAEVLEALRQDGKSTRLNSSHHNISYAVC